MISKERLAEIKKASKEAHKIECAKAIENQSYEILQLAGRCADGAELGHGTLWHAVVGSTAVCGQTYGRRSAGWSSWTPDNRRVTCPKCAKKIASHKTPMQSEPYHADAQQHEDWLTLNLQRDEELQTMQNILFGNND